MKLIVNNREITIDADPAMPLFWVLRDIVGLTLQPGKATHDDGIE